MKEQEDPKNLKKPSSKGVENFARYSGMAFQMIAIILITTLGGRELDKLTGWETPVFTIILSLLGVFTAIYIVIREFIRK